MTDFTVGSRFLLCFLGSIEMAAFYTFDASSGKLTSERIYYDQASTIAQMIQKQGIAVA